MYTENQVAMKTPTRYYELVLFGSFYSKKIFHIPDFVNPVFIISPKVVHRDLAARNVLVGKDAKNRTVCKINDFGFARNVIGKELYNKTTAVRYR